MKSIFDRFALLFEVFFLNNETDQVISSIYAETRDKPVYLLGIYRYRYIRLGELRVFSLSCIPNKLFLNQKTTNRIELFVVRNIYFFLYYWNSIS